MRKTLCNCLIVVLCITVCGFTATKEQDRREIRAVFVATPPVIDGDLGDPAWQRAEAQSGFARREDPGKGGPARVETILRVLYDKDNLYVGLEMHGDDPDKLLCSVTHRDDNIDEDDSVCLYVDTFGDQRSCYFFQVNPIGTQRDIYSTGYGQQADIGWDAIWEAAPKLLADGWSVEYKIPFKILRFNWSADMWFGFDVLRFSSQRESCSEWHYVDDNQNNTLDPRLYGRIVGLQQVDKPLMLQAIVSGVASGSWYNMELRKQRAGGRYELEDDYDAGLDVIWGMTPRLTLSATVNPDFAQIEADPDELNLTGEEIYLEERRPFFRENNALFLAPGSVFPFYSRRIVDMDAGLKLTGQVAGSDIGVLFVRGQDGLRQDCNFAVLRNQSPITDNLVVGGWFVLKQQIHDLIDYTNVHGETYDNVSEPENILAGLDSILHIRNWHFTLNVYNTWYDDATRAWYTREATSDTQMMQLKVAYNGKNWQTEAVFMDVGEGYNPEMGFLDVSLPDNRHYTQYVYGYQPFAEDHLLNFLEGQAFWELSYSREDPDKRTKLRLGAVGEIEFDNHLKLSLKGDYMEDMLFERFMDFPRDESGEIINDQARYFGLTLGNGNNDVRMLTADISWSDGGWQGLGVVLAWGQHYYSRLRQVEFYLHWLPLSNLTMSLDIDYLQRYHPTGQYVESFGEWRDLETWIFRNKWTYTVNSDFYLRTILSGYVDQDHQWDEYALSLLFSYQYQPGSYLYLVYEDDFTPYDFVDDRLMGLRDVQLKEQRLYVKCTYMFDF